VERAKGSFVNEVPRQFHFIFGLTPQTEPFHILHYLCLESCIQINCPNRVNFYYRFEPFGPWWERIRGSLNHIRISGEPFVINNLRYLTHREGLFIKAHKLDYAHQADFLRLKILLEHGGVYADMDTLFVNVLPERLYQYPFVLGEEDPVQPSDSDRPEHSLCNALILSQKGALFGARWLDQMYRVFDGTWSRHSCTEAARLSQVMPNDIHIVPREYFYKHGCTSQGISTLFEGLDTDVTGIYSMHLWSHLWWDERRTDFSTFHAGLLTEKHIRTVDTTYNVLARRFLH